MTERQPQPDELATLVRDLAQLIDASPLQLEVIEAALRSVASALVQVRPSDRDELHSLVAEFLTDPSDADVTVRIGSMLSSGLRSGH